MWRDPAGRDARPDSEGPTADMRTAAGLSGPFTLPLPTRWTKYGDEDGPTRLSHLDEAHLERQYLAKRAENTNRERARAIADEAQGDLSKYAARRVAEAAVADEIAHLAIAEPQLCEAYGLRPHKLLDKAQRMRECRKKGLVGEKADASGRMYLWDSKCGQNKLCPDEAREESMRLAEAYGPELLQKQKDGLELHFTTWSPPNVPRGELKECLRQLPKDIQAWRDRVNKLSPGCIDGFVLSVECHLSSRGDWNVHAHGVVVCRTRPNYETWRRLWGYQLDVQWLRTEAHVLQAMPELFKYVSKGLAAHLDPGEENAEKGAPGLAQWPPAALAEWLGAMQGYRRTRSYGCLYGVKRPEPEPLDLDSVTWVGHVNWQGPERGYLVDLIPDHNSGPGGLGSGLTSPRGPPQPP